MLIIFRSCGNILLNNFLYEEASTVAKNFFSKLSLVKSQFRLDKKSVVDWLERLTHDQHGLGSKPTRAILLCPWERHFTALSPA